MNFNKILYFYCRYIFCIIIIRDLQHGSCLCFCNLLSQTHRRTDTAFYSMGWDEHLLKFKGVFHACLVESRSLFTKLMSFLIGASQIRLLFILSAITTPQCYFDKYDLIWSWTSPDKVNKSNSRHYPSHKEGDFTRLDFQFLNHKVNCLYVCDIFNSLCCH